MGWTPWAVIAPQTLARKMALKALIQLRTTWTTLESMLPASFLDRIGFADLLFSSYYIHYTPGQEEWMFSQWSEYCALY
jgi:hypothetical protein